MPPTSSSRDDAIDLDALDVKSPKSKSKAAESDFEKELEALFAEELASSDEKPASAPPVGGPEFEEDALLLDDLVADAPEAKPAADLAPDGDEDDILDLSAFADGGEMDLTPPDETPGGKDGDIDISGLDDLISGLGDKKPASKAPPLEAEPLDSTDMADLLETLDVPKAAAKPASEAEAEEELLELSMGDLLEEAPDAGALAASIAEESLVEDEPILDLTLPDLSDPEPGRDLIAEQEQADLGGDLNLSLPDIEDLQPDEAAGAADAGLDQVLDIGDLDMSGLMEGIETSAGEPEPEPELSLDPQDLLAQIPETEITGAPEMPGLDEPSLPLADAALGAAVAGAAVAVAGSDPAPAAPAGSLEARLADLATQIMGNSVAVVRLEGQLAERDKTLAEMEQRLAAAQDEAQGLRDELSALRTELEGSLGARVAEASDKAGALGVRVEGVEKTAAATGERLALLEDRQTQMDREIFSEISRAVPREAARVIREEIAHLAASMRDE
jgi:pilus assembly protein FimV